MVDREFSHVLDEREGEEGVSDFFSVGGDHPIVSPEVTGWYSAEVHLKLREKVEPSDISWGTSRVIQKSNHLLNNPWPPAVLGEHRLVSPVAPQQFVRSQTIEQDLCGAGVWFSKGLGGFTDRAYPLGREIKRDCETLVPVPHGGEKQIDVIRLIRSERGVPGPSLFYRGTLVPRRVAELIEILQKERPLLPNT